MEKYTISLILCISVRRGFISSSSVVAIIIYTVDPVLLLHGAIQCVLLDPGFNVPSPSAEAARITATILITYCGNPLSPPDLFSAFARKLSSALTCCFVSK